MRAERADSGEYIAFNARALFWKPARELLYRVYLTPTDAYFIQVRARENLRPERVLMQTTMHLMGPLAFFFLPVQLWLHSRDEREAFEQAEERDSRPLDELLAGPGKNFRVTADELRNPQLDPPGWGGIGKPAGIFSFEHRERGKVRLTIPPADMLTALAVLPTWIGPRMQVNVQWDEHRQRFVKRREERPSAE